MAEETVNQTVTYDKVRKLEKEITRPLCLEPLEQPNRLACDHIYCNLPCLEGLLEKTGNSTVTIICRECRTSETPQASPPAHTPIEEMSPLCPTHPTQIQDLYCETCQAAVCKDCILIGQQHKHHNFSLVTDVAKKKKEAILQYLEEVKKLADRNTVALIQVQQAELDIVKQGIDLTVQISSSFEALFHVLQEQRQALLNTAYQQVGQKLASIAAQKRDLYAARNKLQNTVDSVTDAVTEATNHALISNMSQLRDELSDATKASKAVTRMYKPAAQPDLVARVLTPERLRQTCTLASNVRRAILDPSKCRIEDEIKDSTLGETSTFTVYVANKNNIPCSGHVTAELKTLRDGSVTQPTVTALSPSRYEVSYTPATRGRHELSVMVNGEHITGSPFRVFVQMSIQQLKSSVAAITDIAGPTGVHCAGERILVTDIENSYVMVYNRYLQSVTRIGGDLQLPGKKLSTCSESTTDDNSNIYVTTLGDNLLHKFSKEGTHIKTVSGTGESGGCFSFPNGMCIVDNQSLYVCDTGNCRVLLFDTDLNYLRAFNLTGKPTSVDVRNGKMYVCINELNGYIEVLTMNGVSLHKIRHRKLKKPLTAKVYNNLLYVTDYRRGCVAVFTLDGDRVGSFGNGQLFQPEGLAMDNDGYFYVSNNRKNILVF